MLKFFFAIILSVFFLTGFANDIFIYVSPHGKGSGSLQSPTTLEKAIARLSDLRKTNPKGTITIFLNDGEYILSHPIEITTQSGGTKDLKIIFKAAAGAHPVVRWPKDYTNRR